METTEQIKSLSDAELLRRFASFIERSRRTEAELVAHIAEVDARRLFAHEGFPSMFQYCVDLLHLSEAEAYLRITSARTARRYPALLEMLADGRLHLTAVSMLAKHLTDDNCDEVLENAVHKTKRKIEELIASLAPKPDVPTRLRKLPAPTYAHAKPRKREQMPAPRVLPPGPTSLLTSKPKPAPPRVEPLAPSRYKVQFTASAELKEKLDQLQALRPGVDLAALIDDAVTEKLKRIEAKKFGKLRKPKRSRRTNVALADTSPGKRYIPAAVKRFVDERDGRRCSFVSDDGTRCPARAGLEYHHDDPHARGGDRSPENIRLICKQHNLFLAERVYGREKMAAYRLKPDAAQVAREPSPSFELFPERVLRSANSVRPAARQDVRRVAVGEQRLTLGS